VRAKQEVGEGWGGYNKTAGQDPLMRRREEEEGGGAGEGRGSGDERGREWREGVSR